MSEYIPSDEMYKYIDCRYTGVVVAARRARQLMQEDPGNLKGKPLLRAFEELMSGKLQYCFVDPAPYEEEAEITSGTFYPDDEPTRVETEQLALRPYREQPRDIRDAEARRRAAAAVTTRRQPPPPKATAVDDLPSEAQESMATLANSKIVHTAPVLEEAETLATHVSSPEEEQPSRVTPEGVETAATPENYPEAPLGEQSPVQEQELTVAPPKRGRTRTPKTTAAPAIETEALTGAGLIQANSPLPAPEAEVTEPVAAALPDQPDLPKSNRSKAPKIEAATEVATADTIPVLTTPPPKPASRQRNRSGKK
ncbi:MAG: DNA-directed RNA polymerase subunit omega [Symbiobacteriaceae bacterium]|nr:DNA-directed RNA polymerase subunit omega [Symbiobacteriaceae bacterium]